MEWTLHQKLA